MLMNIRKILPIAILFLTMSFSSLSGCGAIQSGKVTNALEVVDKVINAAKVVCSTIDAFSKPSLSPKNEIKYPDVVNVEQCRDVVDKAIEYKESPQVNAVLLANECLIEHKGDTRAIAQCIDEINGWKILLDELEKAKVFQPPTNE